MAVIYSLAALALVGMQHYFLIDATSGFSKVNQSGAKKKKRKTQSPPACGKRAAHSISLAREINGLSGSAEQWPKQSSL